MDLGALVVLALVIGFILFTRTVGKISGEKARALVSAGATLLDVRTTGEFSQGHIAGAVNIPVQDLERRLGDLPDKSASIVVYCQSGARSGRAKRLLEDSGYTEVHDLGGIGRW